MKKYISIILAVALTLCAGAPALASGLSGEEPAVAAPASLSGEGLVTDAFTYDYGDEWGAYAYHIPKIDRPEPGIQAVNDAIWRAFYDDVMDSEYGPLTAIHEGWSAEPYSINYDWAVNGDVLSLWVWCSYSGDCNYYTVYNVSLTSGRKIADSELLDALGLDQAKYYARMGQVLSDAFEQSCAFCPEDELKQEQRQANNAAANIRAAQPYLGENGDLCAIGTVYALAGAGQFQQPLTVLERGSLPVLTIDTAGLPEQAPVDDRLAWFLDRCDSEYLTRTDIEGFDAEMCVYARNGVYARSGRKFLDADLQRYFEQFDWYEPTVEPAQFTGDMLNEYQNYNIALVLSYEQDHGYD